MPETDRWPPASQDEGQIRAEMQASRDSPHWSHCRRRVSEIVRWQIARAGLPLYLEEDIVQETMMQVFLYLPLFRGEGRLERWLFSVIRSSLVNHQRRHIPVERHFTSLEAREDDPEGAEGLEPATLRSTEEECILREEFNEVLLKIQAFIDQKWGKNPRLKKRNSEILKAMLIDDLPCKDVAEAHGIRQQSVYLLVRDLRRNFQ